MVGRWWRDVVSLYWSVLTHPAFDIRRDLHLCIGGRDESYYSDMALSVHMHTRVLLGHL